MTKKVFLPCYRVMGDLPPPRFGPRQPDAQLGMYPAMRFPDSAEKSHGRIDAITSFGFVGVTPPV